MRKKGSKRKNIVQNSRSIEDIKAAENAIDLFKKPLILPPKMLLSMWDRM